MTGDDDIWNQKKLELFSQGVQQSVEFVAFAKAVLSRQAGRWAGGPVGLWGKWVIVKCKIVM
jgi:hypothetical protein